MLPHQIHAKHNDPGDWPRGRTKPPGWLLDKLAEEKLSGGYKIKRNPVCPDCMIQKSNNGACHC
jgi:hypothetical protein